MKKKKTLNIEYQEKYGIKIIILEKKINPLQSKNIQDERKAHFAKSQGEMTSTNYSMYEDFK